MKKHNLLFMQIVNDYKKYIELGVYKKDDRLPPVRTLALELGINPNTVQRAYQILEQEGYITTIFKKGVYVCYTANPKTEQLEKVKKEIETIKQSNISKEELLEIVEEVYNDSN